MNFKEKVQSMTAKEIILAMVEGLRNPTVKVDMNEFGGVNDKGICYGCAATNIICKITGKKFTKNNIENRERRSDFINTDFDFLEAFENAIDFLRMGDLDNYNKKAEEGKFAEITSGEDLKNFIYLTNDYTETDLKLLEELANLQSQ